MTYVLLSARRVGPTGKAYGLRKAGVSNAEFLRGEIEAIPLPDRSVDAWPAP